MSTLATWTQPDGGWGWVISVVSLLVHGQTQGVMLAMSVMYISWLEEFSDSRGDTSWVISIGNAVICGLGPLPAALANRYGFRVLVIVGGLLTSAGYILSYCATSVAYLVVTIGLIAGLGGCFGLLSAVAMISVYFDKSRSIAMVIGSSGVGIGIFIAAPLINFLTEAYGWRGALLITGGASLNICAYGLLIRPVEGCKIEEELIVDSVDEQQIKHESRSLLSHGNEENVTVYAFPPVTNINEDTYKSSKTIEQTPTITGSNSSSHEPIGLSTEPQLANQGEESQISYSRLSIPFRIKPPFEIHNVERPYFSLRDLSSKRKYTDQYMPHQYLNWKNSMNVIFVRSVKQVDKISVLEAPGDFLQTVDDVEEENAIPSDQGKQISPRLENNETNKSRTCLSSFVNSLMGSIHTNIEILKDPMFLLFGISNIVTNLSYITPAMYLVDRAVDSGLDKTVGALLVSLNGAGNICGRLLFGIVTYRLFPDRFMTYIAVLSFGGLFTMLSPLCGTNVVLHCVYSFLIGCCIGGYGTLVAVVTVDILGMSKASESFGLLMSFMGIAVLIGTPFGGVLFDLTRSYTLTYILYGLFLIGSVMMLLPAAFKRRKREKEKNQSACCCNEMLQSMPLGH